MKTLAEFNESRARQYSRFAKPCKNGIECPTCGSELWDSDPLVTLTTDPPKKLVKCAKCGFNGTRVA